MFKISPEKLKELLVKDGIIKPEVFDDAMSEAVRLEADVSDILISQNIVPKKYIEQVISSYFGALPANLDTAAIDMAALKLLPEALARQRRVVLFRTEQDGRIAAAMEDPGDLATKQFIERYLKKEIKIYFASGEDLNKGFLLYSRATAASFKTIIEQNISASVRSGIKDEEAAAEVPIVAIVDNLLQYAMALRASDVHLEIFDGFVLVRYRIDGILHEIMRIPMQVHSSIIARIKLLGGLKIDEHSKPQDGRFRHKIGQDMVDVRVSIIPTFYGEKVVMRLLSASARPLSFTELGMSQDTKTTLIDNIRKTFGMVLVCGPTGSGKTTTLYSVLNILNRPEVNIVTVEDPIEYDIKYVNQTQVNPLAGITFAAGLRSILRQDPNIIMVGEIRDEETAEISVQSALTGHLVLSTLHTNDAPTAVPRLIDMGVEPFMISAILNAVLSQRLVRKIHLECIESYEPDEQTIDIIKSQLKELNIPDNEIEQKIPRRLYRGKGCTADNNTGYQGRVGIYEL